MARALRLCAVTQIAHVHVTSCCVALHWCSLCSPAAATCALLQSQRAAANAAASSLQGNYLLDGAELVANQGATVNINLQGILDAVEAVGGGPVAGLMCSHAITYSSVSSLYTGTVCACHSLPQLATASACHSQKPWLRPSSMKGVCADAPPHTRVRARTHTRTRAPADARQAVAREAVAPSAARLPIGAPRLAQRPAAVSGRLAAVPHTVAAARGLRAAPAGADATCAVGGSRAAAAEGAARGACCAAVDVGFPAVFCAVGAGDRWLAAAAGADAADAVPGARAELRGCVRSGA